MWRIWFILFEKKIYNSESSTVINITEITKHFHFVLTASKEDHTDSDAFVVVCMSHGDMIEGTEYINTYDGLLITSNLWEPFEGNRCPTLAGKPKLFFIQVCVLFL